MPHPFSRILHILAISALSTLLLVHCGPVDSEEVPGPDENANVVSTDEGATFVATLPDRVELENARSRTDGRTTLDTPTASEPVPTATEPSSPETGGSSSRSTSGSGTVSCTKIEGSDIGTVGVTLTVGSLTVTITGWEEKVGESNEYIGFTYTVSGGSVGDVTLAVKCGRQVFDADGTGSWTNPNGNSGPTAKAISNITFCDDGDGGGEEGGGDVPDFGSCSADSDCLDGAYCSASGICIPL